MTEVPPLPTVDWAEPPEGPLDQLERQVVRGSHFTQAVLDTLVARLANTEAYLAELVGVLRARGVLVEDNLDLDDVEVQPDVRPEPSAGDPAPDIEQDGPAPPAKVSWPGIAFRVEGEEPPPAVEVNCAERMPICHAVCCKLGFALTPPEVESGKVKWDLGFPYMIRHEANGYCSHDDTTTGGCSIYGDRPTVCRHYSCAGDWRCRSSSGDPQWNQPRRQTRRCWLHNSDLPAGRSHVRCSPATRRWRRSCISAGPTLGGSMMTVGSSTSTTCLLRSS